MLHTSTPAVRDLDFQGKRGPGANWKNAGEYPALKPASLWTGSDYLRLAWEIIRRSPRYRLHYARLAYHGLLDERGFFGGRPVLTDEDFQIPQWRTFPVHQHYCEPPQNNDELLGAYVDRLGDAPWKVVHGTWFATRAWGVGVLPDPNVPAQELDLMGLFAPSDADAWAAVESLKDLRAVGLRAPKVTRRYQAAQEMFIRVRLDLPENDQLHLIQRAITRLRVRLGFNPRKNPEVRQRETASMSPFWLRVWDASNAEQRLETSCLKSVFRDQIDALPPEIADHVEGRGSRKSPHGPSKPLLERDSTLSDEPAHSQAGMARRKRTFREIADNWVDTQFDKLSPKARELIEGKRGGTYLADCIAKGLTTSS
ncbi:hypothetical protein [Variovorax paradoxus]|uniref:hypothetical protein n=1 Tax=Variovorax paradoxus TaxID=34073 RepID=UPI000A44DC1E|nr:hypothetical protein [Variovorax paradoxus]